MRRTYDIAKKSRFSFSDVFGRGWPPHTKHPQEFDRKEEENDNKESKKNGKEGEGSLHETLRFQQRGEKKKETLSLSLSLSVSTCLSVF